MFWGRFALRHAAAAVVALAALLYGGPLPLGRGPESATAGGEPAKVDSVTAFGSAANVGPDGSTPFSRPPAALARAGGDGTGGYWLATSDGGVYSFGTARFFGSRAGARDPSRRRHRTLAQRGGVLAGGR